MKGIQSLWRWPFLSFLASLLVVTSQAAVSYLDNGVVKVGVDLNMGGSITYLSQSGTANNVINSYDLGREVQQSYYSGPQPYNPYNNMNPNLPNSVWNPIQSGDSYGNRSTVLTSSNDGQTIYVKCIPLQWALNNVPGECTFEEWITLSGNAVIVSNRLLNARSDTTQYGAYGQELPAVYTIGTLTNLVSYTGSAPFTGDAVHNFGVVPLSASWSFPATESWAAQTDATGWGVGIYNPGAVGFGGGFYGTAGSGGPTSINTGYMSPVQTEILDSNIAYTFNYHLILGTLTQIRNWVYAQSYRPGLNCVFQSDRQHWYYNGTTDTGWPLTNNNCLRVNLAGVNPYMVSSVCAFSATNAPMIYIRAAYHIASPAGHTYANLYWLTNGSTAGAFNGGEMASFPIIVDGYFHTYAVNLATNSTYSGLITQLRLDPTFSSAAGDYVDVAAISSFPLAGTLQGTNLVANGNFTANAAAFTNWPGYTGGVNPAGVTSWSNITGGGEGLNGAGTGVAVGNPFGPTNPGWRIYAFVQGGPNGLAQNLALNPNATYQLDFDVAARAGNTASYQVQIADNTQTYYTATGAGNTTNFTHVTATFTTPTTLSGTPVIKLMNLTAGDNTIVYANVSLIKIRSGNLIINGDFTANAAAFMNDIGYLSPQDAGNPTNITSWNLLYSQPPTMYYYYGLNGAATGLPADYRKNYWGPAQSSGYTYMFAYPANAIASQNLTMVANTTYQLDFDVAGMNGGGVMHYGVDISDNSQTYYDSGSVQANTTNFTHVTATFTTPTTLNGTQVIELKNIDGDYTHPIDFANVSLIELRTGP